MRSLVADDPAAADDQDEIWEREWVSHHYRIASQQLRSTTDEKSLRVFEALLDGDDVGTIATRFNMNRDAIYKTKERLRKKLKILIEQQIDEEG